MTIVGKVLPRRQLRDLGDQHPLFAFLGARSQAGKTVTVERSLGLPAVYACLAVRTDTVAALDFLTYERLEEGQRRELFDDQTHRMLALKPNREMTAATMWGLVELHMSAWGEAIIGKTFVGRQVRELWPIRPDRVEIERKNGEKLYWVFDSKGVRSKTPYTSNEIIHIIRFSLDGFRGISPIGLAREAFGAGLALDEYINKFWAEGAILSGILTTEKELNDDAAKRLERRVRARLNRGTSKAWRIPILEEGLKYSPIALPLRDAQFVEQQKWSLQQAARVLRVPLSMVAGDAADSSLTYRTVEGDNLQYLTHSIAPDLARIEQAIAADDHIHPLGTHRFSEWSPDALLRTDAKTRAEVESIATGRRPWKRGSEVRKSYGLPPDDKIDELGAAAPAAAPESDGELEERVQHLEQIVERIARR